MSDPSIPLFLRAAAGEDTSRAPVWIMRQAGRYLPEYRALREKHDFWQMVRTPELATEVSLQPLRRFDFDAVILFSDIMTPLPAMGIELDFDPGPVIVRPLRSADDVRTLRVPDPDEIAPFVAETLRQLRAESTVPVIGFGGAPLTLAAYAVEGRGSKDFSVFRTFLRSEPQAAHALLDALANVSVAYLRMQIQAGAQAIQLFDSWAGMLDEATYRAFGLPYAQRVLRGLSGTAVPRIYLAVGSSHLYRAIDELEAETVSVDWRLPLSRVRSVLPGKTLQGNLDPTALLGPQPALGNAIDRVLLEGRGGAHVFNLGHGILRQTDPDHVAFLVERVHGFDRHASPLTAGEPVGDRSPGSR